ncbi:uncharacterized protein LACBIDRAFT_334548 [Laccaria bicolor S238N-H82]|uniref:Predicted protein n=1 Tax=Laccaria bicolor (strain S238N-H82 / ATCC MYA-4686) TaxID=486041 RepID=B0DZI0_LACBS|nr:uncharacterized protein LACBIDRAFT_334548 [Laccaria bicolor S238N-H82]EDR00025.1 predicted protein [Laccaria bicolor S238N-H82]|eukprot:XP_001889334.1 predicted protein [Laccaria bicolor S238N-H82]
MEARTPFQVGKFQPLHPYDVRGGIGVFGATTKTVLELGAMGSTKAQRQSSQSVQRHFASLGASDGSTPSSPRSTFNDMEALLSPILLNSAVNSPPPVSGDHVPSVTDLSLEVLLHIANTSDSDLQKIQDGVIKLCAPLVYKQTQLLELLLALSATCHYNFHYIKGYIQNRTRNLISEFQLSVDRLFHVMNFYGAVIGGSCALSMIGAEASTFCPLEMTLYLPYEYHNTLTASLFQHLQLLGRITGKNHNPLVTLIEWYAFGRPNDLPLHITAVFTTTNYPIEALFHSQYSITLMLSHPKEFFLPTAPSPHLDGQVLPPIPSLPQITTFEPTLAPHEVIVWFFGGGYGCTPMGSTFPCLFGTIPVFDLI